MTLVSYRQVSALGRCCVWLWLLCDPLDFFTMLTSVRCQSQGLCVCDRMQEQVMLGGSSTGLETLLSTHTPAFDPVFHFAASLSLYPIHTFFICSSRPPSLSLFLSIAIGSSLSLALFQIHSALWSMNNDNNAAKASSWKIHICVFIMCHPATDHRSFRKGKYAEWSTRLCCRLHMRLNKLMLICSYR